MSLVIAVAVTIAVVGISFYLLMKLMGGGREISNATDAGALNIAKQAIRTPSKPLRSFSNPDIASNFVLLADNGNASLLAYNRFVAQAVIVALNAKSERTPEAADHAKKVWRALNDVSEYLHTQLKDANTMKDHFGKLASSNTTRMLGNSSTIELKDYAVGYMHRGGSTNVYVNSSLWSALANDPSIPFNNSGTKSPTGEPYLSGYKGINVQLSTGDTLTFSGVPVFPQAAPHLISTSEFEQNRSDNFISNYPDDSLPPNAFRSSGTNVDNGSTTLLKSVACAVVGVARSPEAEFPMAIPGGYIAITNGPSSPKPTKLPALTDDDIFSHELANVGVYAEGSSPQQMFTQGYGDAALGSSSFWDDWYRYNTQPGHAQPNLAASQQEIKRGDGQLVTLEQLRTISVMYRNLHYCIWEMYDDPPIDPVCVEALDNFKRGYNRPGTRDNDHVSPDQFTTLEAFKVNAMAARYDVKTCATVLAPSTVSGVKWFDHTKTRFPNREQYSAPAHCPYNFGVPKSPDEYLSMIEQVTPDVKVPVTTALVQRCQQIDPQATAADVTRLLKAQVLPLGGKQFIFMRNNKLVLDITPPTWVVAGTTADGAPTSYGNAYDVRDKYVNSRDSPTIDPIKAGDGNFYIPFDVAPDSECTDKAIWRASSGYNNLLGELSFSNSCTGGGQFCRPN